MNDSDVCVWLLPTGAFWLRRLVWALVIVANLALLVTLLKDCIERVADGGTVRIWSRELVTKIQPPAITLCHGNGFRKSRVLSHTLPETNWGDWFRDTFATLNWTSFDGLDDFYDRASYSWPDMVGRCAVNDVHCEQYGMLQSHATFGQGVCTTLSLNTSLTKRLTSGQITIALMEKEDLGAMEHAGWRVYFHSQDTEFSDALRFMDLATEVRITRDHMHHVKLHRQTTLSKHSARGCSRDTTSLSAYTKCLGQCFSKLVTSGAMPCSTPWGASLFPDIDVHQPCRSLEELEATGQLKKNTLIEDDFVDWARRCPSCQPHCTAHKYLVSAKDRWRLDETTLFLRSPQLSGFTGAALEVHVLDQAETVTERNAYPPDLFLAEVGGNLGLLIGASLLTIVEMIDLGIVWLFRKMRTASSRRVRNI